MRIFCYCLLCWTLVVLSTRGIASSQDTNFATGPQYLMNYGSPLLARSISTPSMSLAGPPPEVGASDATDVLIAGASNQTVASPSSDALPKIDLFPVFYTEVFASDLKPSFSLAEPFPGLLQESSPIPPVQLSPNNLPEPSVNQLPPSILDNGVWQMTTVQALRERGYGVTLAEAAADAKARIRRANHIYTNADAARLHDGN